MPEYDENEPEVLDAENELETPIEKQINQMVSLCLRMHSDIENKLFSLPVKQRQELMFATSAFLDVLKPEMTQEELQNAIIKYEQNCFKIAQNASTSEKVMETAKSIARDVLSLIGCLIYTLALTIAGAIVGLIIPIIGLSPFLAYEGFTYACKNAEKVVNARVEKLPGLAETPLTPNLIKNHIQEMKKVAGIVESNKETVLEADNTQTADKEEGLDTLGTGF